VIVVKQSLLLAVGVAGAVAAVLRRRKTQADAALWREATSDSSR
jgi:very-short-patch-repair endonuclease